MKTLIISILLALVALVSPAQTASSTTSQTALKTFEDSFLSTGWSTLSDTEKQAFIFEHYRLKILAAKEIEINRIATESATIAENAAKEAQAAADKQQFIDKLKSIGFACDNGLPDWERLYNYPEIYGSTYKYKAALAQSQSPNLDYFLKAANEMLYMPYEVGKYYKVGDCFVYQGDLYKVLQPHNSQADWLPNATASLYLKATIPGTIAAWKQPTGSSDAYKKGDRVTFNGSTYESLIDANVWSPTAYPAGWKKNLNLTI